MFSPDRRGANSPAKENGRTRTGPGIRFHSFPGGGRNECVGGSPSPPCPWGRSFPYPSDTPLLQGQRNDLSQSPGREGLTLIQPFPSPSDTPLFAGQRNESGNEPNPRPPPPGQGWPEKVPPASPSGYAQIKSRWVSSRGGKRETPLPDAEKK